MAIRCERRLRRLISNGFDQSWRVPQNAFAVRSTVARCPMKFLSSWTAKPSKAGDRRDENNGARSAELDALAQFRVVRQGAGREHASGISRGGSQCGRAGCPVSGILPSGRRALMHSVGRVAKTSPVVAPRQHHSDSERDTVKKRRPANDVLLAAAQKDTHKCWSVKRRKTMPRPDGKKQADAAITTRGRNS